MFDQLHDPDPPAATSRHLAVAAERAAGMRRRRAAAFGAAAVVGLVAAGTVAVAATGRSGSGDTELADAPLPPVAETTPSATTVPPTTVLDPESLPPAVPVNPDPEDLPPAVPADPGADDAPSDDQVSASGDPADAGTTDGNSDSSARSAGEGGTDASDGPTISPAEAAVLRAGDPVVAVTTGGRAVWFASADDDPITIADGGVVRVDFLGDGTATVEAAGSSTLRTVTPDGAGGESLSVGTSHAVSPDGSTVCALGGGGVRCTDGSDETTTELDRADVVAVDLTWFDADTALVLGRADTWTLTVVDVANGSASTLPFAALGEFGDLRFAGRDGAAVVLHDTGTDVLLVGTLDRFGAWDPDGATATALDVRRTEEPLRSMWMRRGTEVVVAIDGTLTIGNVEVAGSYVAARA